jgi:hypothetical protein
MLRRFLFLLGLLGLLHQPTLATQRQHSQYHLAVADGSWYCRFLIFDCRLVLPKDQSKIGN